MTHFVTSGAKTPRPEELSTFAKLKVLLMGINVPKPCNLQTPEHHGLDYEVHRFMTTGGLSIEGWHLPHSQPRGLVLLFHGYTHCKARLLREAKAFHDLGFATFLVDFRGSGGSSGDSTSIGVFEADDVSSAYLYVRQQGLGQRIFLFGQSMGSVAILRAVALGGLNPQGIILECPFDRLLTAVERRFAAMGIPAFPAAHLLVFWGGLQHGFNGFKHNAVEYAGRVQCPVLLLSGEDDPRVLPGHIRAVFRQLRGKKHHAKFAGLKHESFVAAQPQIWKGHVADFMQRLAH
jgi:alpha-beta hydrolase superfamily lysophospholipase